MIFVENPEEHQQSLNVFQKYCEIWKLTVNAEKTKVMIFSNGRISKNVHFYLNNKELEIVSEFKYLGIYLSQSGDFNAAKKHISEQANKAFFSLIRKTRRLNLSYDVQIDLFEKTIKPILLYSCEIWGFGNNATIERVHLKFLKIIFRLKRSTPSFMIYGELGLTPITVDIQARIVSYWSKLLENDRFKLTSAMCIEIFECIEMEFTNQSI